MELRVAGEPSFSVELRLGAFKLTGWQKHEAFEASIKLSVERTSGEDEQRRRGEKLTKE